MLGVGAAAACPEACPRSRPGSARGEGLAIRPWARRSWLSDQERWRRSHRPSARVGAESSATTSAGVRGAPAAASSGSTLLVGDIGGTNARIQIARISAAGVPEVVVRKDFSTKEHKSLLSVVETFLRMHPNYAPKSMCFAVAGPVDDGLCFMTNLEWTVDAKDMSARLGVPVAVLNDFEAIGYGIHEVPGAEVVCLNDVPAKPRAPIVVIGPGTGLGACQLFWDEASGAYKVYPGEGTHSDFAPRGEKQRKLLEFVERELGYCEIEHVGCGSGLERIYQFLQSTESPANQPIVSLDAQGISQASRDGDPLARNAMDMMLSIVGQEAGHMALRCMAQGGVYVAGGIVPKNMDRVLPDGGELLRGFLNRRSRLSKLHASFRLSVVMNQGVGLLGAMSYAQRLVKDK